MPVPHRILVALDGSTCADAASSLALQLAQAQPCELSAVHVVNVTTASGNVLRDLPHRLGFEPAVVSEDVFKKHKRDGEELLDRFQEDARLAGIDVKTHLLVGGVGERISWASRHADLLVVGLRGETEDRFPGQGGARAASFLEHVTIPILVAPKGLDRIGAVATGYDGSIGAAHAVTAIRHFLLRLDVPIHGIFMGGSDKGGVLQEMDANLPDAEVMHHVIGGDDPHIAIAEHAMKCQADVLALGFRGQSPMKDFLFGSATEYIALNSTMALLVAH